MRLDEILSSVVEYKLILQRENLGEYVFDIEPYGYSVLFSKYPTSRKLPECWEISFTQIKPEYRIDLTKTGKRFQVLSTVIAICKEWFQTHPPICIKMSAKHDSRKTLYPKIIK